MRLLLIRKPILSQFYDIFVYKEKTLELEPFIGEVFVVDVSDINHYKSLYSDVFVRHPRTSVTYLLDLSCFEPADDEAKDVFNSPQYKQGYIGV